MTYVDGFLLDLTERVCQRIQLLTGRSNVWLAGQLTNLSIVVYFIWAGASFLRSGWPIRVALGVFCGGVLYALTQTVLKVPVETSEQSAYLRVARGLRNPRRVRDAMLRLVFMVLAVMMAGPVALVYATLQLPIVLLAYSLVVLTTVLLYVLACDPLPPCPGMVAEWVRRWSGARGVSTEEGAASVSQKEQGSRAGTIAALSSSKRWPRPSPRPQAPSPD